MSPNNEHVEVQLELGHHAYLKNKIGPDEHTHDWMVFVRGPDDCKIHEFIDRVVFNLHDSYPRHKRTFREPPYQVNESGYAGFELPIEIYFKNKDEPKKITYEYDLYLHMNDSVINTRREKLTFQNPSAEFKKKLLKAGGKCHTGGPGGRDSSLKSHSKSKSGSSSSRAISSPRTPSSHMSSSPAPPESKPRVNGSNGSSKIHHHRVPGKDISSTHSSGPSSSSSTSSSSSKITKDKPVKASAKPDQQFTDLFGPPIQTRPSPDSLPSKSKEKSKKQKSHHPEKSHSGERSNSRNSNSSGSTRDSTSNGNNNRHSSSVSIDSGEKIKKSSSKSTLLNTTSLNSTPSGSSQLNGDYVKQLYWIQKKINELQDPNILQKLVDIIESHSASFNVTKTTFDFDLLRLDESTVSKLKEIIQGT